MKPQRIRFAILSRIACVAGLSIASASAAYTVLVDLGAEASRTSTTGGVYWNNVSNPPIRVPDGWGNTYSNLVDTAGSETSVGLTFSPRQGDNPFGWSSNNAGGLTSARFSGSLEINGFSIEVESATTDYFFSDNRQAATITLTGLAAGSTYDLYLWGSRETSNATSGADYRWTRYTVTDGTGTLPSQDLQTSGAGAGTPGYYGNNDTIIQFTGLVPDANGEVLLSVQSVNQSGDPRWGYLNVLGLVQVPEPGSALLAGLGGLTLLARRRRNGR